MKRNYILFGFLLLTFSMTGQDVKIGYYSLDSLYKYCEFIVELDDIANAYLEQQQKRGERKVAVFQEKYQKLFLPTCSPTTGPLKQEKIEKELAQEQQDIIDLEQSMKDYAIAIEVMRSNFLEEKVTVFATQKNYELIINIKTTLYHNKTLEIKDITNELIEEINTYSYHGVLMKQLGEIEQKLKQKYPRVVNTQEEKIKR